MRTPNFELSKFFFFLILSLSLSLSPYHPSPCPREISQTKRDLAMAQRGGTLVYIILFVARER